MRQPQARTALVVVGVDGSGRSHRLRAIPAGVTTLSVDPAGSAVDAADLVERARAEGAVVLADDTHLLRPEVLATLAAAARGGIAVRLSRRPTIAHPALAELDAAVAAAGQVVELAPLSVAEVSTLLAAAEGRSPESDRAAAVHRSTAGLPALVVALADPDGNVRLRARVARQLAWIDEPAVRRIATVLAVAGQLADEELAAASGVDRGTLAGGLRALRDAGLVDPAGDRMVPVVADALRSQLTPAEQRAVHDEVARVMGREDELALATQLRAADSRGPAAAHAYATAGERLRFADPAAAAEWFELAVTIGAEPGVVAAGRAEVSLLLGRPPAVDAAAADAETRARLLIAEGVAAAHEGRSRRAAESLLAAPAPGPVLAVPSLVAIGRLADARTAAAGDAPKVPRLVAEGMLALREPAVAVPLLIEAAEAFEAEPGQLLPDTPHALGAVAAVAAGDTATADDLLARAVASGLGGPHAMTRHRLLLAWVRLRAGQVEPARAELVRIEGALLPGRERLLAAALTAGVARRGAEASLLQRAWTVARPAVARQTVDLLVAEITDELLVAAARLREPLLADQTLDELAAISSAFGPDTVWRTQHAWSRLQVAIARDDPDEARLAAASLAGSAGGPAVGKHAAQARATTVWAAALAGEAAADEVAAAAAELAAAGLPWEASRLCGHAAIRVADAGQARRLLEQARDLSEAGRAPEPGAGGRSGLTERELEVGRLVLAGETHKAIGAQLYLSPKTVEHHVARIRTKLGAADRAEMIAALREISP